MKIKYLYGLILVFLTGTVFGQEYYQSVDKNGNVTLSDRPIRDLKIVKRYNIKIQDRVAPPRATQGVTPRALPPALIYMPPQTMEDHLPAKQVYQMEAQLNEDRIANAKQYRECLDTNRPRRELGASLELLCDPRYQTLWDQQELSRLKADVIRSGR